MGTGSPPERRADLMAEMMVSDFSRSLAFWTGPMGFAEAFSRPAQKLACLQRPEGAQIMIFERDGDWETGVLEPPFGRGAIGATGRADSEPLPDQPRGGIAPG